MKRKLLFIALLSFIAIPLMGYSADTTVNTPQSTDAQKKPLYWVDPMEPAVHYSAPGKSRMGMNLVPVYEEKKGSNSAS